jgi:hypothetical protein
MAFNLGSLAPLAGLMESDKLLQQRQLNQLRQREMMQNLQMGDQQQQALGALWPALQQSSQQQQQPIPQIPQTPTSPAMQAGAGQPTSPLLSPNLAGSGVNWQGESPEFKRRVSSMLEAAPPYVREGDAASVDSASRTFQQQADIYERSGHGTKFMAAPPGKSLHEKGEAADWSFKTPQADQWVHQNAERFGLGFPLGPRDPKHMQMVAYKKLDASLDQSGNKLIQQGADGPTVQDSTKAGMLAGREIDPVQWGRATRADLVQAIEKANPDLDPKVKALAFLQMNKILAPEEKMQAMMWAKQNEQDIKLILAGERAAVAERGQNMANMRAELARDNAGAGTPYQPTDAEGKPIGSPGQVRGGVFSPIQGLPEGAGGMSKVGSKAPGAGGLSGTDAEWAADYIQKIGSWPISMSRNKEAQAAVLKVLASRGVDPTSIGVAQGAFKADSQALAGATKLRDAVHSYEGTALRNLDQATKEMEKAAPTGFGPFLNHWVMTGELQMGDTKPPAAVAAVLTFANEYAKVMSGSTGAQAATDTSRREAAQMFSPYFNNGQWGEAARIAKTDMGNRMTELDDNVELIKSRMARGGGPARSGDAKPKVSGSVGAMNADQLTQYWSSLSPEDKKAHEAEVTARIEQLEKERTGGR